MTDRQSDDDRPHQPNLPEAAFYGGVGLFGGLVLTLIVGLSIIGFHESNETRDERNAVAASEDATDAVSQGEQIYAARCASCHGAGGEGGVGPSLVGVTERFPSAADQEALVRSGRGAMPAFDGTLSADDIAAVVAFEREVLDVG